MVNNTPEASSKEVEKKNNKKQQMLALGFV